MHPEKYGSHQDSAGASLRGHPHLCPELESDLPGVPPKQAKGSFCSQMRLDQPQSLARLGRITVALQQESCKFRGVSCRPRSAQLGSQSRDISLSTGDFMIETPEYDLNRSARDQQGGHNPKAGPVQRKPSFREGEHRSDQNRCSISIEHEAIKRHTPRKGTLRRAFKLLPRHIGNSDPATFGKASSPDSFQWTSSSRKGARSRSYSGPVL